LQRFPHYKIEYYKMDTDQNKLHFIYFFNFPQSPELQSGAAGLS